MTPAQELRAALVAHAPLVSRVGGRVRSDLAAPNDPLPLIVYKRFSLIVGRTLDGTISERKDTFQVECWGTTRTESSDIAELAIEALDAAGLPVETADPDALDPTTAERAVVLNVDIWT